MATARVREMTGLPPMDPNMSNGSLLWSGHHAAVVYECQGPDWPDGDDLLAVIEFDGCIHAVAGGPNDEAFHNHPMYAMTGVYSMSEIDESEWMTARCRIQDRDGRPDRLLDGLHHYVLAFKENTVELLANTYRLKGVFPSVDPSRAWAAAVSALARL